MRGKNNVFDWYYSSDYSCVGLDSLKNLCQFQSVTLKEKIMSYDRTKRFMFWPLRDDVMNRILPKIGLLPVQNMDIPQADKPATPVQGSVYRSTGMEKSFLGDDCDPKGHPDFVKKMTGKMEYKDAAQTSEVRQFLLSPAGNTRMNKG